MRRLHLAFSGLAVVGTSAIASMLACGGSPLPEIDAPVIDAALGDGGSGSAEPACTGAVFDPCTDTTNSSDCGSDAPGAPMCKEFIGSGFTVCTQTCTLSSDCPLQDGSATFCNAKGICKPNGPNACKPS